MRTHCRAGHIFRSPELGQLVNGFLRFAVDPLMPPVAKRLTPARHMPTASEEGFAGTIRPLEVLSPADWLRLVNRVGLSERESEVLRGVLQDERVAETAARLGVSKFTVDTYRERLFRKLRVSSATQLVSAVFAIHLQLGRS